MDYTKIVNKAVETVNTQKNMALIISNIEDNYGLNCPSKLTVYNTNTYHYRSFAFFNEIFDDSRHADEPAAEGFTQAGLAMLRIAKRIYDGFKDDKKDPVSYSDCTAPVYINATYNGEAAMWEDRGPVYVAINGNHDTQDKLDEIKQELTDEIKQAKNAVYAQIMSELYNKGILK